MKVNLLVLRKIFFAWVLMLLIYRLWSGLLISQWEEPRQFDPYLDVSMWLIHWLNINDFIIHYPIAIIFDGSLVLITFICLFKSWRWAHILFTTLFCLYIILFNMYAIGHGHNLLAIAILSVLFWFKTPKSISFYWHITRYYFVFVYFSAFIWKILRHSVWQLNYGKIVYTLNNYTELFTVNSAFSQWCFSHPMILYLVFWLGILLEGSFILALWTDKYDKYFFWIIISFHFMSYILLNIHFFPFMIAAITFIPLLIQGKNTIDWIKT